MSESFERDVIDRLGRIEEQNKTQFKRIEAIEHTLNGEDVGLTTRVRILENQNDVEEKKGMPGVIERIQRLEDKALSEEKSKAGIIAWIAIALSAISTLIGWIRGN